jgi:hypothetical protein
MRGYRETDSTTAESPVAFTEATEMLCNDPRAEFMVRSA